MTVSVLIVDDSGFFRKRLHEILSSVPEIKVVGAASNGREALDLVKKIQPDVVTMDYEMPVMDGVTAVRHIMAECPTPILMFSSLTYEGARVTLDALEAGAVDFLPKNFEDIARDYGRMQEVLKEKDIPNSLNAHVADSEKRYKTDKYEHGFIAQEVKEAIDKHSSLKDGFDMWAEDPSDGRQRVGPTAVIPMLIKAIQELSAEVEKLKGD